MRKGQRNRDREEGRRGRDRERDYNDWSETGVEKKEESQIETEKEGEIESK